MKNIFKSRRAMTGLETAIILVAFVITAAAFAFVILNMGFLTAEKAQSVISAGMSEASSSMLIDSGLVAFFSNTSATGVQQADICLTKVVFYMKLSQGHEPVDCDDSRLVATFTNDVCHGEIYNTNGTVMTIMTANGDTDTLLETGEKFKVEIDFTELLLSGVEPVPANRPAMYTHPYENFRVEIRPSQGAVMTIERQLPAVYTPVMVID
jgi:flagellin FlaB